MKKKIASGTCGDISKRFNIGITIIPQIEERKNRVEKENILEILAENLTNWVKDIVYRFKNLSKSQTA